MSENIPAELEPLVDAVRTVVAECQPEVTFRDDGENRWHCDVYVSDENVQHALFLLDADDPLLAVYVMIQMPPAMDHIGLLLKAIAYANNGLLPGCFEINIDDGELHYRSALSPVSTHITPPEVAHLLDGALLMSQTYAPAFQKIAATGADPIETINEIEKE